jgi:hypothetical protein
MPVIKGRYDFVKVYRPRGTKYSEGRDCNLNVAMSLAKKAFLDEFGYEPPNRHVIIEVVGSASFGWQVSFFDLSGIHSLEMGK